MQISIHIHLKNKRDWQLTPGPCVGAPSVPAVIEPPMRPVGEHVGSTSPNSTLFFCPLLGLTDDTGCPYLLLSLIHVSTSPSLSRKVGFHSVGAHQLCLLVDSGRNF